MTETIDAPCGLHGMHTPVPTYCELHHVVPQEWQAIWHPPTFNWPQSAADKLLWPDAAKSPDHPGLILWDARTAICCRTGHGNVHHWLVEIMHGLHDNPGWTQDQVVTKLVHHNKSWNPKDVAMAEQAPVRFFAAGGDLNLLFSRNQWGQI